MLRTIHSPFHGRTVKMGRKRPVAIGPHLRLRNYLRASLPAAPASTDYAKAATVVLADIYGNDELGDCVIAGGYHVTGVETGNAGDLFHATSAQIIKDYSAIGGYVPGDANTDQGCDEPTALNYWTQHGFANGTKLEGWLGVDATNKQELMQALYLFENLYFGLELPDAYVNPFPSGPGFTWGVVGDPVPENGHCIVGVDYTTAGVVIDSWGMTGTFTWDAVAKYCVDKSGGAAYVLLSPDQLAKGQAKAPNGVAWTDLISDFDTLGGKLPVPDPVPVTPAPPAGTPVTLAQAQAWAKAGIAGGSGLQTRSGAEKLATASLAAQWPKT